MSDSMQDTPAGKAAERRRKRLFADADAMREALRQQGALAERMRIIALLRERLGEDDDASAACLRISDLADELEAHS